ncbi:subtilisin SUB9 [Besnoitia besnoiti]|uniref:subtilisin n=1 Tax=Besnoitia besnoiti TaxID=94643 RepID=A0A2A9ML34_BESBE|nr:subtilisin SUB9 [Besnoitia besnoiti]PFH38679.1 subtilisin SUB9 [Besnoitia besnoiti]
MQQLLLFLLGVSALPWLPRDGGLPVFAHGTEDGGIEPDHFRTLMVTFHEDCDPEEAKRRALQSSLQEKFSALPQAAPGLGAHTGSSESPATVSVTAAGVASYEAYTTKQFTADFSHMATSAESEEASQLPPSRCVVTDETLHRVGVDIINLTDCPSVEGGELKLAFERDPCVSSVEFDQLVHIVDGEHDPPFLGSNSGHIVQPTSEPDAPKRDRKKLAEEPYWLEIAGFDEASDLAECLRSEVVAVIDTGVAYNHPSLRRNMWKNPGEIPGNDIDDDNNGFVDDVYGFNFIDNNGDMSDDNGHGTHCAGIIAGLKNTDTGARGVCGTTSVAGLKFMGSSGSGATSDAVKAINYCIQMGIRISNNSWGGPGRTDALEKAIVKSHEAGHICVVAAGNAGQNIDRSPSYPASYSSSNIVAVAATDSSDSMASFSNTGARSVHVAAPGVAILSTYPPDSFKELSGTSMASPVVAGLAALLVSLPFEDHLQVKEAIMEGVDKIPATRGRVKSGGRINAAQSILWLANALGMQRSFLEGEAARKHLQYNSEVLADGREERSDC